MNEPVKRRRRGVKSDSAPIRQRWRTPAPSRSCPFYKVCSCLSVPPRVADGVFAQAAIMLRARTARVESVGADSGPPLMRHWSAL